MLGFALASSPLDLAVAARAERAGHPAAAGYLLAAVAVGSVGGGLAWGARTHRRTSWAHLAGLLVASAVALAAAGAAPTLPILGGVLVVLGAVVAPVFVVAYLAADDLVPAAGRTEATTWVNTANNVGLAIGAAGAGLIIDRTGTGAALTAGATVALLTAGALVLARRQLPPTR